MGLPFRIVLYASAESQADTAAAAAFARISQLNDILSDYDSDSELSRLSRSSGSGKAIYVSEDLWNVLQRSQKLAAQSRGAFDITVGPAVTLWRKARREHKLPDAVLLARTRDSIGYKKLLLDGKNHTAKLLAPNMRLDAGAIAKGYAVDEAQKVLRKNGITSALVSGGGDMNVSDAPPGKKGWRIEIAPLDIPDAPPKKFVLIHNVGLATSGDVFQHLEIDGKRYSHIVDPRTGIGLTDHSLVTVIAKDCTTADSLATAVSVLGPEKGVELINKTSGAAVHLVRKTRDKIEMSESRRFSKYYDPTTP
jgi:thiamine biosynthesis lipoprotein